MADNPFKVQSQLREQHLKKPLEPAVETVAPGHSGSVGLPPPKPRRKQCGLYLDVQMMDKVKQVAQRRGVSIGAVIEACVKIALERLEE